MIPNKINISGIEYTVEEVDNVIIDGSNQFLGACYYTSAEIQVRSDLPQTKKEQTFVHEMLHAIFNEAGYSEQDEDMVNRVGIVLYQVLKNNTFNFKS